VEAFSLTQAITGPKAGANVYGIRDMLTLTRGKHSLYFGGEGGLEKDFQLTSLNNYGSFTFSTTNGTAAARTTNGLSDYVAGIPAGMGQDTSLYANANYFSYAAFVQDDWRILPNLTLNLGLRYDWQQAATDPQHMQGNFVPGVQSHAFSNVTILGSTRRLAPIGMLFPGDPGVPIGGANTPQNHVSPRLGFALDPFSNGKTVIHGAAGLFFGGIAGNLWELPSNSAPYSVRNGSYSKVTSLTHPYQGDPTEFPTGANPYPQFVFDYKSGTATFLQLNQVLAMDPNYKWPYSIQLNFGFTQQFGNNTALSVNYVGSLNRKSPIYHDINSPIFNITAAGTSGPAPGCTTAQACGYANGDATVNNRRPLNSQFGLSAAVPTYSNVWIISSTENSNYNGLQITIEQRLTHRVSAKGFYTWSKTLQSNSGLDNAGGANGIFVDANYPQLESHVRSDADRRHMMTMSFVWKPDYFDRFHPIIRYALNGWTVTGIWSANSGGPFNIVTGVDNYFSGLGNNRPSLLPGRTPRLIDNGHSRIAMMNQWFDTSAYCRPGVDAGCPGLGPLGLLGNARANTLDNPGYRNVDASLIRDFGIHESIKFQIRGEVVNVFNLVNLTAPQTSMSAGLNFGKITGGSATDQRIIQVGGRILF
jgi:hypothetical protein